MKNSFKIAILLVILFANSCSQMNIITVESATGTPLPMNTVTPTNTPVPFSLSGNFAFAEEDKIHIYSADGTKIQTVQTDGWVSKYQFSQQGKMVAYSAYNKLADDLYYYSYGLKINNLENNQKFIIVNDNDRVLYFTWNEENGKIVYMTPEGVYTSTFQGEDKEQLMEFPEGIFEKKTAISQSSFRKILPSPDGRYMFIQQDLEYNADIFLIDMLLGTIVQISTRFNCGNTFNWMPNGRYFLCGERIFDTENLGEPKAFDSSLCI